jgi:hypothetical protein
VDGEQAPTAAAQVSIVSSVMEALAEEFFER